MSYASIMMNEKGFTISELLVGMVIVSIIAASSIAFFSDLGPSFDRWNSNIHTLQDLRFAQTLAITEGCRVIVDIADDGKSYAIGCDYLDYDYVAPHDTDKVFLNRTLPDSITLTADTTIIFNPRGQCIEANGNLDSRSITLTSSDSDSFLNASILPTGVLVEI